ncbi:MAG: hypothetical protein Q9218_007596 [Villophora microphyllina]
MADPPQLARLCRVCKEVNFAGILTPREWNGDRCKAIYRPEYSGKGGRPSMDWGTYGKKHRTEQAVDRLPSIRTAAYDELSISTQSGQEEHAPKTVGKIKKVNEQAESAKEAIVHGSPTEESDLSVADPHEDQPTGSPWPDKPEGLALDDANEANLDQGTKHAQGAQLDDESHYGDYGWFDDGSCDEDNGTDDLPDDHYEPSMSTWSGSSHFTEISRIDLDKQAQGHWDYCDGDLYYLGSIWDLRSRRHECDLCRRLWCRARRNSDIKNKFLTSSRCILKLLELKGRKVNEPKTDYGEWIIKPPLVLHGTHRDIVAVRNKIPADQVIPFDDKLYGQARWRNDDCDYGLFRDWLRMCETKHEHTPIGNSGGMSIRLIDVEGKCVIEFSGLLSQVPRYVALSYVWGRSQQKVMLTKDRLSDFEQHGFLDQPLDQTIRDAIDLTSRIGEKYLWVDALCIFQDDPEDKTCLIPQMDKIFGKAVLTIVAAYGNSADAGLPGVGIGSRKGNRGKLEMEDIRIVKKSKANMFATHLAIGFREKYLGFATYSFRAWTFQEGLLSTRALVFTKDQVYWECDRCTWCEDTHWESDTVDFISWRAVKGHTPEDIWMDNFDRNAYDMPSADEPEKPEPPRNSYASLVRQYSVRDLTYDDDILNACTGVLSSIKESEQSDFLFALRTKYIGNDLLFNPTRVLPRRFPNQNLVHVAFPTWSWLSWTGRIEIANEPRYNSSDPVKNLRACDGVKCYVLGIDQCGQPDLRVLNETGGWHFEEDYVRVGEGINDPTWDPTATEMPQNSADIPEYIQDVSMGDIESHPIFSQIVPNFHLIFRTFCSTVALRTYGWNGGDTEPDDRPDGAIIERKLYTSVSNFAAATTRTETQAAVDHIDAAGPQSLEQGVYIGRLPLPLGYWGDRDIDEYMAPSGFRDMHEYMAAVPDGIYRLLWMNNKHLPMWGHLLCKPASASASVDGNWEGEILQRVSAAIGPTDILSRAQQKKFAAKWELVILG